MKRVQNLLKRVQNLIKGVQNLFKRVTNLFKKVTNMLKTLQNLSKRVEKNHCLRIMNYISHVYQTHTHTELQYFISILVDLFPM